MKHTADSGAFLQCPDSPLRQKQEASHHVFAFVQLRAEDTEINPHWLKRKLKMPKIINLGNCVEVLWDTTF